MRVSIATISLSYIGIFQSNDMPDLDSVCSVETFNPNKNKSTKRSLQKKLHSLGSIENQLECGISEQGFLKQENVKSLTDIFEENENQNYIMLDKSTKMIVEKNESEILHLKSTNERTSKIFNQKIEELKELMTQNLKNQKILQKDQS